MSFNGRMSSSSRVRGHQTPQEQQKETSSQLHKALVIKKFVELISLDVDLDRTRQLLLPHKNIVELPTQLGSLLSQVRRLDLSFNNLTDLAPLSSLTHLTNLNVSHNTQLVSLSTLNCSHLLILTASYCNLSDIAGITKCNATLRTLVLNDNNISLLPTNTKAVEENRDKATKQNNNNRQAIAYGNYSAIASLQVVETIILSRNATLCALLNESIKNDAEKNECKENTSKPASKTNLTKEENSEKESVGHLRDAAAANVTLHPLSVFAQLSQLRKLSLSECNINSLPSHWYLPKLNELRLAHNSLESLNPDGVLLQSLKILDVSHNQFHSIATLRRCKYLQQLSLSGNSVYDINATRDESTNAKLLLESMHYARINESNDSSSSTKNATDKEVKEAKVVSDKSRVPLTLQRALHKMFVHLTSVDGQALLPESVLSQLSVSVKHFRAKRTREEDENNTQQNEHGKSKVEVVQDNSHDELQSTTEKYEEGKDRNLTTSGKPATLFRSESCSLEHICHEKQRDGIEEEEQQEQEQEIAHKEEEMQKATLTSANKRKQNSTKDEEKHTCHKEKVVETEENATRSKIDELDESDVVYTPSEKTISANITHVPIIKRSRVYTVNQNNFQNNNTSVVDKISNNNVNISSGNSKYNKGINKKSKKRGGNSSSKANVLVTHGTDAVNAL